MHRADTVAFLDMDAELLAPRYRAAEQAMTLLVRAARLLGARADGGRLLVQTRLPRHEVLQAALLADPARLFEPEWQRRQLLRFPPAAALARVTGPGASEYAASLDGRFWSRRPNRTENVEYRVRRGTSSAPGTGRPSAGR